MCHFNNKAFNVVGIFPSPWQEQHRHLSPVASDFNTQVEMLTVSKRLLRSFGSKAGKAGFCVTDNESKRAGQQCFSESLWCKGKSPGRRRDTEWGSVCFEDSSWAGGTVMKLVGGQVRHVTELAGGWFLCFRKESWQLHLPCLVSHPTAQSRSCEPVPGTVPPVEGSPEQRRAA